MRRIFTVSVLALGLLAGGPALAQTGCPTSGSGVTCFSGKYFCAANGMCTTPVAACPRSADSLPTAPPSASWARQALSCSACGCSCPSGYSYCGSGANAGFCSAPVTACPAGTTWDPCAGVCRTPYVLVDPASAQGGSINMGGGIAATGDLAVGGDAYLATGKAVKVNAAGTGWLNMGNWSSPGSFVLNVIGDIYSNGRVGIGTASPAASLQINGTSTTEALRIVSSNYSPFVIRNAADTADLFRVDQNGNVTITGGFAGTINGTGSANYVAKWSDADTLGAGLIYDNGTNVGIGLANPGAKLAVRTGTTDPGTYDDGLGLFVSRASSSANQSIVEFRHDNLSQGVGIGYASIFATGYNTSQPLEVFSRGTSPLVLNASSGGNVGIGNAIPAYKLDVVGDLRASGNFYLQGTANMSIYDYAPGDANWRIGMSATPGFTRAIATNHVQYATYYNYAGQGFAVGTNGGLSDFEVTGSNHQAYFRGKVGIGSVAPYGTLQIAPAAGTEGLRIISSDYSPLVIRNASDSADLLRVNQNGDVSGMRRLQAPGCVGHIFVGLTSAAYTPAQVVAAGGGYSVVNGYCSANYAAAHVCTVEEMLESFSCSASGDPILDSANDGKMVYVSGGPPGYTAFANDCYGWQSSANDKFARIWTMNSSKGGVGAMVRCDVATSQHFACCR